MTAKQLLLTATLIQLLAWTAVLVDNAGGWDQIRKVTLTAHNNK